MLEYEVTNEVEPRYNEDLGTMKITLSYQVFCYFRVKKKYKELGPAKLPCYKVLLYDLFITRFHCTQNNLLHIYNYENACFNFFNQTSRHCKTG